MTPKNIAPDDDEDKPYGISFANTEQFAAVS